MRSVFKYSALACVAWCIFFQSATGRSNSSSGVVSVNGYVRKDGTYVPPHHRSSPDGSFYNNWSTVGNINPFTGKSGSVVVPNSQAIQPAYPATRSVASPPLIVVAPVAPPAPRAVVSSSVTVQVPFSQVSVAEWESAATRLQLL